MKGYASPEAFKQALEARLRRAAQQGGTDMGRLRQLLVFDRFLARVHAVFGEQVVVKGGVVLELRLEQARTTKDIDLRLVGASADVLESFQKVGRLELGDSLTFEVSEDREHPVIKGRGWFTREGDFERRPGSQAASTPHRSVSTWALPTS